MCKGVELWIQGFRVVEDFFPFELGCAHVVLGVTWLQMLGEIRADWLKYTLKFFDGSRWVGWQGDLSLSCSQISLHSLSRRFKTPQMAFLIELCETEVTAEAEATPVAPFALQGMLGRFGDVFSTPVGLPPARDADHRIVLTEGATPPNIRLYRYPYVQKGEIERLVTKMMTSGIIRHSTNRFSSLVILVKKRDGSWRFCVDYRALNHITVPDKFSIPIIDELLGELDGAVVFSKLDLRAGYHQIRIREGDI